MKAWQLSGVGEEDYGFLEGGRGRLRCIHTYNIHSGFGFSGGFLGFYEVFQDETGV